LQRPSWRVDLLGMELACPAGLYHLDNILEGCRPTRSVLKGFTDQHGGICMVPALTSMDLCK
jgi:hypothetical protein